MVIKTISNIKELNSTLEKNKMVVVDYSAKWCGPCNRIYPFYEGLSNKYEDVLFLKVDIEKAKELSKAQKIQCLPTFHFYKNNELIDTIVGANKESIEGVIENNFCLHS